MGKHSYIEQHDYIRLLARFDDKATFNVNMGRYGTNHTAEPNDALADRISAALENVRQAEPKPFKDYGDYLRGIGALVDRSKGREDFLKAVTETYGVSDRPVSEAGGPSRSAVAQRRSMAQLSFQGGEALEITLNERSQATRQWPPILTRGDRIMNVARGLESVVGSRAEALATMVALADGAGTISEWEGRLAARMRSLAAEAASAPERDRTDTKVTIETKRSTEVRGEFENGDSFSLTLSGKSVSHNLRPFDKAMEKSLMGFLLNTKSSGLIDNAGLAGAIREAAEHTSSLAEFVGALPDYVRAAQAGASAKPGV